MLVSYIQEHGAGNWRAVPPNTGTCSCVFLIDRSALGCEI